MARQSEMLLTDGSEKPVLRPLAARTVVTIVGLAVGLASAFALFLNPIRFKSINALLGQHGLGAEPMEDLIDSDRVDKVVGLWSEKCDRMPYYAFEKVLYSNLNNIGPDSGKGEGYVIQARDMTGVDDIEKLGRTVYIVLNSTSNKYKSSDPKGNRMRGVYASVNLQQNDEFGFKMTFFDHDFKKMVMKHFIITFFDLDADRAMHNATDTRLQISEKIDIGGFKEKIIESEHYLKITDLDNGMTRFEATQLGEGEDNPKNYEVLVPEQRKRAMSLKYEDASEIRGRFTTTGGDHKGYRQFFFLAQPTLECARTLDVADNDWENYPKYPKDDLTYRPPLEMPAILHEFPQIFWEWIKKLDDTVREGDVIATVKVHDVIREIKSPANGTIVKMHDLVKGDRVDLVLAKMHIAIISQIVLPALPSGAGIVKVAICSKSMFLDHYTTVVRLGRVLMGGELLAVTYNGLGQNRREIRASQGGVIEGIQSLKRGQTVQKISDLNLITIHKFPPLEQSMEEHGCCQHPWLEPLPEKDGVKRTGLEPQQEKWIFKAWIKFLGDYVEEDEVIATVTSGDEEFHLKTSFSGFITVQLPVRPGMVFNNVTMPIHIAAIGRKLRALEQSYPEAGQKCPGIFKGWKVNVGDKVEFDQLLVDMDPGPVRATAAGYITKRQEGLKSGMKHAEVAFGDFCILIGPGLDLVTPVDGDTPVEGSFAGMTFREWNKNIGDEVAPGDLIATTKMGSQTDYISAPVKGIITKMAAIKPGDEMDKVCNFELFDTCVLATVGVTLPQILIRDTGGSAEVPGWPNSNLKFAEFKKKVGEEVDNGQAVAVLEGENGITVAVNAPHAGIVLRRLESLVRGMDVDKILSSAVLAIVGHERVFEHLKPDQDTILAPETNNQVFENNLVNKNDVVSAGETIGHVSRVEDTTEAVSPDSESVVKTIAVEEGDEVLVGERIAEIMEIPDPVTAAPKEIGTVVDRLAEVGEQVQIGAPLVKVDNTNYEVVKAPIDGTVKELADVGTRVGPGQASAALMVRGNADSLLPAKWVLSPKKGTVSLLVKEGDRVGPHVPIAAVTGPEKVITDVVAPRDGVVEQVRDDLIPGEEMKDPDMVVIGKPSGPSVGLHQVGVSVPKDAIFKEWLVERGDHVKRGDEVAIIQVPVTRRLTESKFEKRNRNLGQTNSGTYVDRKVYAPQTGYIVYESHLVPGQKISNQQVSSNIAVIEQETIWYVPLFCFLLVLCCIMGCLFRIMKKPEPPPAPEPVVDELKPLRKRLDKQIKQGCRLDFERPDKSIHSVYARFRPLGIHHGSVAPLVAKSFSVNSYAKDALGVQLNDVLVGINGESVRGDSNWDRVSSKLNQHLSEFPQWPLEIQFRETMESPPQIVTFVERPIGIEYFRRAPVQVDTVLPGSPAAAKGVSTGWYITRVGSQDVKDRTNFNQVMAILKDGIQPLDEKDDNVTNKQQEAPQ